MEFFIIQRHFIPFFRQEQLTYHKITQKLIKRVLNGGLQLVWSSRPEFDHDLNSGPRAQNSLFNPNSGPNYYYSLLDKNLTSNSCQFQSLLKSRLVLGGTGQNDGTNSPEGDRLGLVRVTEGNPK